MCSGASSKLPCVLQGPAGLSAGDDAATTSWQPGALQTKHIQVGSTSRWEAGEVWSVGSCGGLVLSPRRCFLACC